ncbi:hypothetical protein FRC07_003404 [Ceratobasidium sp. 392]|nr:hypothetical protein FRC07_003404 [Ceratobasidium sp. 392]
MSPSEKLSVSSNSDSGWDSDEPLVKEKPEPATKPTKQPPEFREVQYGVWTLYYPITNSWREYLPALESLWAFVDLVKSLPIIWKFITETLSLAPVFFAVYFASSTLASFEPAFRLFINSKILSFVEDIAKGASPSRERFERLVVAYLGAFAVGFVLRKLESYSNPILQQRVRLHFRQRLLAVRSRFDLATAENPDIKSKTSRASSYYGNAWAILEGIAEWISIAAEVTGQLSVITQVVRAHEHARLFVLLIFARPLAVQLIRTTRNGSYYCMLTDLRWLRMDALFDLGTEAKYKKEVIADNLEGYINSQYDKDMKDLGDTPTQDPFEQISNRVLLTYGDFDALFESLPLFVYAWGSFQSGNQSNLSSLVLMQQAANSLQNTFWRVIYSGSNMSNLFKNTLALYEVLELKSAMADGTIVYPEEKYKDGKGVSIEFKSVDFRYPMTDKLVLKDLSFSIKSGQLCVIVGENGCGKSTTINMISRMYDCTSGEVLIDGRPIGDYVISSFRAATSVMYQDYHHLPLTIRQNILLGRPDCENPNEAIEEAAKLGGAYDFVQKLPLKFDTNLKPNCSGYSNTSYGEEEDDETMYQKFIDAQKDTKLSGGEWQRLALSKSFMKNSDKVRLLCYDEPSASLDPKAEYEMFERLRKLRGEKTMIFVTHRFGHLTKYADLILYVKEGSIVEKGTHKELLAMDGEYAKMYKIQSQAFVD